MGATRARIRGLGVVVSVTALLAVAASAQASVLSRARASAIALRALHAPAERGATVVFAAPSPVGSGAVVFEATPGARLHPPKLAHPTWLFWEDQHYQALFVHPSRLVLVDAQTGRVLRNTELAWFPLVNGRRPVFLSSAAAYHDRRYWVFSSHLPRVRLTHAQVLPGGPARAASAQPVVIQRGELGHDCLILLGDRHEPILTGSFAEMLQWGRDVGLTTYADQATSVATLRHTVAVARAAGCDDVFLYIGGHGEPPPNWRDPSNGHIEPGGPAAVNLNSGVGTRSPSGAWTVVKNQLAPQDLADLLAEFPDVGFKIKIESCFSGRFAQRLVDSSTHGPSEKNLLDLELSAPSDQVSYGQIKVDKYDNAGHLVQHNAPVTDNPFAASEFTNGDYHGLEQWARMPAEITKTGGDLAQGIADSFTLGLPFNAATSTNITGFTPTHPSLYTQPPRFRDHLESHVLSDGFDVTGWTHGRFDTVQVDAPSGDQIVAFDAHGHQCVLIDNQGAVYSNTSGGITLPPGRFIVSVRCDRKPVDDDIHIDVTLASGNGSGQRVTVTIVKDGTVVDRQVIAVHP